MGCVLGKQVNEVNRVKTAPKASNFKTAVKQPPQVDTGQRKSNTPVSVGSTHSASSVASVASTAATPPQVQGCRRFSLQELAQATGGWAAQSLIGTGRSGDTYRGVQPTPRGGDGGNGANGADGGVVWAVKRARVGRVRADDFHKEVKQIGSKHHVHLVRLVGFCAEEDAVTRTREHVLVYEFMPNGNLFRWIGPCETHVRVGAFHPVPALPCSALPCSALLCPALPFLHMLPRLHPPSEHAHARCDLCAQTRAFPPHPPACSPLPPPPRCGCVADSTAAHGRADWRGTGGAVPVLPMLTRISPHALSHLSTPSLPPPRPGAAVQLTLQQRMDVLIGVAQAVQYLHAFSLVHAHIHPANVLLDKTMRTKLTDLQTLFCTQPLSVLMPTPVHLLPNALACPNSQYLHAFSLVHAHIHPANVLLDKCMRAKLSDFGLNRDTFTSTGNGTRDDGTRDDGTRDGTENGARAGVRDGRRGCGAGVQAGRQGVERRDVRGAEKVEERGHGGRDRQGSNKVSNAGASGAAGAGGAGDGAGGAGDGAGGAGDGAGGAGDGAGGGVWSAGGDASGYEDPEFLHTHQLSPAVDVYSVGVLALMLLTARTATAAHQHGDSDKGMDGIGDRHVDRHVDGHTDRHPKPQHADERATLIHWVASLLPAQNPATFTDPFLLSPSSSSPPPNPRSLLRIANLALSCTALPSTSRPSVNKILYMLTEIRDELFGAARSEALERVDREVADMRGGNFLAEMARAESLASRASVSGVVSGGTGVS
ncbi:unnamed protein product [Closterium sp. NIES-53]